jgi:dephospho-CoA kinase
MRVVVFVARSQQRHRLMYRGGSTVSRSLHPARMRRNKSQQENIQANDEIGMIAARSILKEPG